MVKEKYMKLARQFDSVMNDIGCEYIQILKPDSELNQRKEYYGIADGITLGWMLNEAVYWYDCYFEDGNVRHDDQFIDAENYKFWLEESTELYDLIQAINAFKEDVCIEEFKEEA